MDPGYNTVEDLRSATSLWHVLSNYIDLYE